MKLLTLLVCISLYVGCSQAHQVVACPAGWMQFGRSCYSFFGLALNQITAENVCRMFSGCAGGIGHLVSINTKEENVFIFNHLKSISGSSIPAPVWLGGRRRPRREEWVWSDGTPIGRGTFSAWANNQAPQEQGRNCMSFSDSPWPQWTHLNCGANTFPYICEMAANIEVDPATCDSNNPAGRPRPNAPTPVVQNPVPIRYNKAGHVEQRYTGRP